MLNNLSKSFSFSNVAFQIELRICLQIQKYTVKLTEWKISRIADDDLIYCSLKQLRRPRNNNLMSSLLISTIDRKIVPLINAIWPKKHIRTLSMSSTFRELKTIKNSLFETQSNHILTYRGTTAGALDSITISQQLHESVAHSKYHRMVLRKFQRFIL